MELNNRLKKRLAIFLFFPFLSILTLVTDDITIRVISSCIIVVWAGIFIFVRDASKLDEVIDEKDINSNEPKTTSIVTKKGDLIPDFGEGVKIVKKDESSSDNAEISIDAFLNSEDKPFQKPRDFKKKYEEIAQKDMLRSVGNEEQFNFVLEIILEIIKEIFGANTALFYWYNKSKKRLTLEKYVSESGAISEQKLILEDDILSKIAQSEEPEVLSNIPSNSEVDNIRYYTSPQSIKSFAGVPLFFEKKITGILAVDSTSSCAYGIEHIYSLGRFVRIISIIIALFEEKSSDTQAEKRLESLLGVINSDLQFNTENELADLVEHSARNIVDWDALSFIYFYPNEKKFKAIKVINKTTLQYIEQGTIIELDNTLVGKVIKNRTPIKIDDSSTNTVPRYNKSEYIQFEGSFLAIPLAYEDETYGVVCFENLKKQYFTNNDMKILKHAVKLYAFVVFSYSSQAVLKDLLTVDTETKVLNKSEFVDRVKLQLQFVKEFNVNCALVLLNIDEFVDENTLFDGNVYPKVMKAIVDLVKAETSHNNIFGRLSSRVFGIFITNSSTNDAFAWAEKIRLKIARKPLNVISNQSMYTISLGVAGANSDKSLESILDDAELALKKAIEKGGNNTKVA
ncbi:MAG: GAF domain-containing protein [bacterium]